MIAPGHGAAPADYLRPGETGDTALGGAVRIIQPRTGYRFAVDSVLLARFASERPVGRAVDLGCGAGVVGLCLLALRGAREIEGVDIQEDMVDRAQRAAAWNGWEQAARFARRDLRSPATALPESAYDLAVANPPYRPVRSGHISPLPSAALSRHEVTGSLSDVAAAARHALRRGGCLCLVYPASRLTWLLSAVRAKGIEPKVLRLVHPRPDRPATLALVRAVKGAKEGLELTAPLFLHGDGNRYSPEAARLLGPP